ncbi:MAG TPA: hypothetical protein VGX23_03470 [Actinocrinis sp.]|nr:hypothetical protein [Actinocrinis sp.]
MPWRRNKAETTNQPATPQFNNVNITGIQGATVTVGTGNTFVQNSTVNTQADTAQLDAALSSLRNLVQSQAGLLKVPALDHVAALDAAAKKSPPDAGTVTRVREWFAANLPAIAPAVLDVIANPTVDTAVKAAAQIAHGATAAHPSAPEHAATA